MREIKFRVWDNHCRKWLYTLRGVRFADQASTAYGTYDIDLFEAYQYNTNIRELNKPLRYTIQQYTGLKDKNDKEIYEGDIVKAKFVGKTADVYWDSRTASFRFGNGYTFSFEGRETEITGNIFENER